MKILIIFYIIFLFNMSARNLYSDEIKIDQEKYIYITELNETYIDMKNLCKIIEERFKIKTQLLKTFSDVEFALNRKRYQYYAPEILKKLLIYIPRNGIRLLGLLDKDIYDNGLNFVFGEAFERVCIVSITRFKPCVKSDEKDNVLDKKTEERTIKTVIHELGHTFGLHHCENYKCVMFFSNQISDTDNKSDDFCERCKKLLKINIKNELPGL